MSLRYIYNIINNLDDSVPVQILMNEHGQRIEVRYVGNYTDPETQASYFVYATNDHEPIFIPQPLAIHQQRHLQPHQVIYNDDYPADPMESPPQSPLPRRHRSEHQLSARQRQLSRRAERREAMQRFHENMFANPDNIFNQQPRLPMERPASPVRNQPPNPNSRRSRRRQQRQQQSNVIPQSRRNRVVGGGKKSKQKTRRAH